MAKVKVCGLTSEEDAVMVCEAGADMVGVIVDVNIPTPREIDCSKANKILRSVPREIYKVVVTMPSEAMKAVQLAEKFDQIDYLQIHNSLALPDFSELKRWTDLELIGVFSLPSESVLSEKEIMAEAKNVADASDIILLDKEKKGDADANWERYWKLCRRIRENLNKPVLLAGGLNPENVQAAIEKVDPYGVDVASGVETEPGQKDPELVRRFIRNSSS